MLCVREVEPPIYRLAAWPIEHAQQLLEACDCDRKDFCRTAQNVFKDFRREFARVSNSKVPSGAARMSECLCVSSPAGWQCNILHSSSTVRTSASVCVKRSVATFTTWSESAGAAGRFGQCSAMPPRQFRTTVYAPPLRVRSHVRCPLSLFVRSIERPRENR